MGSIRTRLLFYLLLLFFISLALVYNISSWFITKEYLAFEIEMAKQNTQEVKRGYDNILRSLQIKTLDWSRWDDAYEFMKTKNPEFVASNLGGDIVCQMELDYILFVGLQGDIVAQKGCDYSTRQNKELPDGFLFHLSPGRTLTNQTSIDHVVTGIVSTLDGPLLVTAQSILNTQSEGPSRGTLIMARFFTQKLFTPYLPTGSSIRLQDTFHSDKDGIYPQNNTILSSIFTIPDIYTKPAVQVELNTPRTIFANRFNAYVALFLGLSLVVLFMQLGQIIMIEYIVVRKITNITSSIAAISKTAHTSQIPLVSVIHDEKGEFALLQQSVNNMITSLMNLHSTLSIEQVKAQKYIDVISNLIVVLNNKGIVQLINTKGCEMLGYTKEELIGANWIEKVVLPNEQKKIKSVFSNILQQSPEEISPVDNILVTKQGEQILVRWHTAIVRNKLGAVESIIGSGYDITHDRTTLVQLEDRIKEIEKLNKLMINRELDMAQLKERLKKYEK